nr:reverse transcriptase domain-containing protein [Tanacetum cinerariifolium]
MLCDAPILALPEGPNDFVVYCDASNQGFGCKVNIVANALSRKERMKLRQARAMSMTIHSSIKARILEAQSEPSKDDNTSAEMLKGLDKQFEKKKTADCILLSEFRLPRTSSGHDSIWVIIDRLTKSAYFLAIYEDCQMKRFARLYTNEIVARHGVPVSILSDRDSCFTSRFWQSLYKALGMQLDMRKCRTPIAWAKVGEIKLTGPEIVQETTDKSV